MSLLSENIFINGSFDIWLNGTEFTDISSATEVAGKWSVSTTSGALGYARRSDVVPVESVCEYSLELETGAADMAVDLRQRIDARYAAQIQRVVTFSAVIYNGAETAITPDLFLMVEDEEEGEKQIIQLTKASLQACAPGAWTKVVHTFDLGQEYDLQAGGEFKLRFAPFETGALVRVTELKLESGGAATPFTRRFYEQELSLIKGESYLDTSLFDQDNSLLKADTAAAPFSLVVSENTLVGNTGDGIAALSPDAALNLIGGAFPVFYERDACWAAKEMSVAADRYTLLSPKIMTVNVGGTCFRIEDRADQGYAVALDLSDADCWDDTDAMDYTVAANRAGVQFYIYACDDSGTLALLLSANSTYPDGYGDTNSRKIGGFHCLCKDVGTISGHTLSGYVAGDILPTSVWDLKHRPVCDPAGMTYCAGIAKWVDIYLASVSDEQLVSVNGGTIADGESGTVFDWYDFVEWLGREECGKRLPTQSEFMAFSDGSNQGTQYSEEKDPVTTGGHNDTAEQRMISNCGCEDCCGAMWQWLLETGGVFDTTITWIAQYNSSRTDQRGKSAYFPIRGAAGGNWSGDVNCGSRGSYWNYMPRDPLASASARGVAAPLTAT